MVAHALVNPAVLRWARERAASSVDAAARAAHVTPDRLEAWERGDRQPTFRQAQKLAQALHAPFGFFFLPEPPVETLPLPDLRTLPGPLSGSPSLNLQDTVRSVLQRQSWYLEYLESQGAPPLAFVGRFSAASRVEAVAQDIRGVLGVAVEDGGRTWEACYRELIAAAEDVGILVMRSGIVDNNTRRTLDVGEFRGFAISDAYAAARLHQLRRCADGSSLHGWPMNSHTSGSAAVASPAPHRESGTGRRSSATRWPANSWRREISFSKRWSQGSDELARRVAALAQSFHVSKMVVWRRAHDLDLIDATTYRREYLAELTAFPCARCAWR